MTTTLHIGIIGDFNPQVQPQLKTNDAILHAAGHLSLAVEIDWLPTKSLINSSLDTRLNHFDALWAGPGSYESSVGAMNGIRFCREQNRPFFGT
jgi:CTP synthase (UTP-ammonia lyase)